MSRSAAVHPDLAWSWVDHLRGGGTEPWTDWSGARHAASGPTPAAGEGGVRRGPLPGAQQLELLRRINALGRPDEALVERVLRASAWGRGRADLPLVGLPEPGYGAPAVDPGDLRATELLRFAALLLADALADAPAGDAPAQPRAPSLRHRLRRGHRLGGDPWLAEQVRRDLVLCGRPPGGLRPRVLVLAGPVEDMLADAWTRRCLRHGAPGWAEWVGRLAGHALPSGADASKAAERWAAQVGAARVAVVTDAALLPRLLGVRRLALPAPLVADSVELARLVGGAMTVAVEPRRRPDLLMDALRPLLTAHQEPGPVLGVPQQYSGWVQRRAVRQRRRLLEAGYVVHGDLDQLLARPEPGRQQAIGSVEDERPAPRGLPEEVGVLRLANRLLLVGMDPTARGLDR